MAIKELPSVALSCQEKNGNPIKMLFVSISGKENRGKRKKNRGKRVLK
jgi:hypothetical protein